MTEDRIRQLEAMIEEEYSEENMYELARGYMENGMEKEARKLCKKTLRLFPVGNYTQELNGLLSNTDRSLTGAFGYMEETSPQSTEKILSVEERFKNIVGMDSVKERLGQLYMLFRLENDRKQNELTANLIDNTNFIVCGGNGSGKTTVAECIGNLLYDFGIRGVEEVTVIDRDSLNTALSQEETDSLHKLVEGICDSTIIVEDADCDAIKAFNSILRQEKSNLSIILCASAEDTEKALMEEPELHKNIYEVIKIPEYTDEQLYDMAVGIAGERGLHIQPEAKENLIKQIKNRRVRKDFANAITIGSMISDATKKMAQRYYSSEEVSQETLKELVAQDFAEEVSNQEEVRMLLQQLEDMTGLDNVKSEVKSRLNAVIARRQAQLAGARRKTDSGTLHMVFAGPPGTGKTTVARIIGKLYRKMGILSRGDVIIECTRKDLVAEYVGQTAVKVGEVIQQAMGGVLFIDEAYSLCRDSNDVYGREAVDELISALENYRDNLMVIFAGYTEEMEHFLDMNEGLRSRIGKIVEFPPYSEAELEEIFYAMASSYNLTIVSECREDIRDLIAQESREKDFGNARGIRNILDRVIDCMNQRIANKVSQGIPMNQSDFDEIRAEDIRALMKEQNSGKNSDRNELINGLIAELNGLIGIEGAKKKVSQMLDTVYVNKTFGLDSHLGTLHMVFKGNAGTGKTTVARLIGKIYGAMGILGDGDLFIECGRSDLVGEYAGHTAVKTKAAIERATGGILFIDEAYSLIEGENDSFGQEAINTLIAEMENRRDCLVVILAGYSKEMDAFLGSNQGLRSRISNEILFEDYTLPQMTQIYRLEAGRRGLTMNAEVSDELISHAISKEMERRKDFGNARGIRNMVDCAVNNKNTRIAALLRKGVKVERDRIHILSPEDIYVQV